MDNKNKEKNNNDIGKILQISKGENSICIECTSIFTNLDDVIQKYINKGYSRDKISIRLSEYEDVTIPFPTLEKMKEQLQILTSNVDKNDSQIEKFTKIALSIRKNISYAFEKTKNRNIGKDRNFIEGLINGRCVCSGYSLIMKAALEMHGIKSEIVSSDRHAWNIVNLGNQWYHWDMTNTKSEVLSVDHIAKCLKTDRQLKQKNYNNNNCTVACDKEPSAELINAINNIAKREKHNIPKMIKEKMGFIQKLKNFFRKDQDEVPALPEPKHENGLSIESYSPLGILKDDILWEIQTWDKSDVKNKIDTSYIILPKIGSPEETFSKNPEMFTAIFKELKGSISNDALQFLGSINYDKENNSFTACSIDSPEMNEIKKSVQELISKRIEFLKAVSKNNNEYQRNNDNLQER